MTTRQRIPTYDRALNMLEARSRSVSELRRLLLRKGEPAAEVDAAIDRLKGAGYLDDAGFARQFARSKALSAGLSKRRLHQELARRGVARHISQAAIDDVFQDEAIDDATSIERVAKKRLRMLDKLDATTQRRRLYAFLARRGYESDDIARAMSGLQFDPSS